MYTIKLNSNNISDSDMDFFNLFPYQNQNKTENLTNKHIKALNMDNMKNFTININYKSNKVKINSTKFLPKIRLFGIEEDNTLNTIVDSLHNIEEEMPNILMFPLRPVFNLNNSGKYSAFLDSDKIIHYKENILNDTKNYLISNNEGVVYKKRDNLKTLSLYDTLILKQYERIFKYDKIKIILSDIPIYKEIETIIDTFFSSTSNGSDMDGKLFVQYLK